MTVLNSAKRHSPRLKDVGFAYKFCNPISDKLISGNFKS